MLLLLHAKGWLQRCAKGAGGRVSAGLRRWLTEGRGAACLRAPRWCRVRCAKGCSGSRCALWLRAKGTSPAAKACIDRTQVRSKSQS